MCMSGLLITVLVAAVPGDNQSAVEQDWLRQAAAMDAARRGSWRDALVTTKSDAAGAVDGVKDGKYAFHTGHQPNPWW